jgi:hypothetical protein
VSRILFALMTLSVLTAQSVRFVEHTIATGLTGGYQVVVADLNRDGKPDLIALASGMPELVWYENPSWQRHVIATGFSHMINCAVADVDKDGIPEIVLASDFANQARNSVGTVSLLRHHGDPREIWDVTEFDRLPTSHRLRMADIDGNGSRVVINAPLTGAKAEAPDYRDQTPLVFYRPGVWKREYISEENTGLVHGLCVLDWDGNGRDEILTAGFEGIHLFKMGGEGKWTRSIIARGNPAPWPKSGSSDIAVGHLGRKRILAAIEPWHGNQVVIYHSTGKDWQREVIDDTLVDGHTIQVAGFSDDGDDDVVAGYRGQGQSVYLYHYDRAGKKWTRRTLDDGGMAAAACVVADLNGDKRKDIACIGAGTANLKWYENLGPAKH